MTQLRTLDTTPLDIGVRAAELESGEDVPRRQLALPVLVFLVPVVLELGAVALFVALFGASERTTPQGSLEALASGIFFSDSL